MGKILILSNSLDAHADEVERGLNAISYPVVRLNTDKFATERVKLTFQCDIEKSYLEVSDSKHYISEIMSVLYRRPEELEVGVKEPYQKAFAEKEASELLKQFYHLPWPMMWVSRVEALEAARRKLPQLIAAERLGMKIPNTLVTNSAKEAQSFFVECGGQMIYKTLISPVLRLGEGSELWGVPTTHY